MTTQATSDKSLALKLRLPFMLIATLSICSSVIAPSSLRAEAQEAKAAEQEAKKEKGGIELRRRPDGKLLLINNDTGDTAVIDNPNPSGKITGMQVQADGKIIFVFEKGDAVRVDNPFLNKATPVKDGAKTDSADTAAKNAGEPFGENAPGQKPAVKPIPLAVQPKITDEREPLPSTEPQKDKKEGTVPQKSQPKAASGGGDYKEPNTFQKVMGAAMPIVTLGLLVGGIVGVVGIGLGFASGMGIGAALSQGATWGLYGGIVGLGLGLVFLGIAFLKGLGG